MNKLLGRGPGWVFLRKEDDAYPRWYRVETTDLLSQFESELDSDDEHVIDYSTEWCTSSGLDSSRLASLYGDLY